MIGTFRVAGAALVVAIALLVCGCEAEPSGTTVVFPASAVGKEAEVLRRQIARFEAEHPEVRVELRPTPDAADQRHQLYVQWLNARASQPDILQLDVIWTSEFAAAGWILPLDRFQPDVADYFPAIVRAACWRDALYALPWFADVGMLYYRSDLVNAPETFEQLTTEAQQASANTGEIDGFVWPAARYEGLVCVFLEFLGGFGGQIMDERGRVTVDSREALAALEFMRDAIYTNGITPPDVLVWQEEQTRFRFQNGSAAYMRNWPYAFSLLADAGDSRVAGKFGVTTMPAAPGGRPTAALGGSQLAINAHSEHAEAAWQVIEFLTRPEQMIERAAVTGQFPARRSVYDTPALAEALEFPPAEARRIIEHATPRPVTPVYTELSGILQVWLHRALTRQAEPSDALEQAAAEMRALLERVELSPNESSPDELRPDDSSAN